MNYTIRRIAAADNKRIEKIIRDCLIEYGGNHEGTAWMDPDLGRFSEIYVGDSAAYWVAEDPTGTVVGGVGIGPLPGVPETCELQKMYCIPAVRGTGAAQQLMDTALAYAAERYRYCYLETLESMDRAQAFYEKYGFRRVTDALGATGHDACEVRLRKELN